MHEIAERCGVSKGLVSRILNGDNTLRVSDETRRKVLDEVEHAGYVRNPNAQALASRRNLSLSGAPRIGYLTFTSKMGLGHPYFSRIIDGISEAAVNSHCQLAFRMPSDEMYEQLEDIVREYSMHPLDGLILLGKVTDPKMRKAISEITRYVVSMDGIHDRHSDYVGVDIAKSILLPLEHLLRLQYRDIGIVYGDSVKEQSNERLDACEKRMEQENLTLNPDWRINGAYSVDVAYERLKERLTHIAPPRALVVLNDEMAIGCIKAIQEAGYRVPEQVAVTGHDDISLAAYVDVPLTTVHIYKKEMGRLAVKILLDRVESGRKNPIFLEIPGKLIKRDSCGWKLENVRQVTTNGANE